MECSCQKKISQKYINGKKNLKDMFEGKQIDNKVKQKVDFAG